MQLNVKYRSWSCQGSQKLQNNASSHYPTTIFALCIYFLQYETPLFRVHVFGMRRLIHTSSLSWSQNLNFRLGDLRCGKRRGLAFYARISCLRFCTICASIVLIVLVSIMPIITTNMLAIQIVFCWQPAASFKVPDWPFLNQIHPIRFLSLWNCQAFKLPNAKIWKQNLFSSFRYSENCFKSLEP